jgi:DNA-binding CsgD family transcriptional regulator
MATAPSPLEQLDNALLAKLTPAEIRLYTTRMSTNPPMTYRDVAFILKVSPNTVASNWSKLKAKIGFDPLQQAKEEGLNGDRGEDADFVRLRNVSPDTFSKLIEVNAEKGLRMLTKNWDRVPPEKIPGMIRDLINSRQVIRGEPTQILRVDQRQTLAKMLPAMLKEAAKRGMSFELGEGGARIIKSIEAETVPNKP